MIPVDAWLHIDAVLDNAVGVAVQSGVGDEEAVALARDLRERGWEACGAHPLKGDGLVGWPPLDALLRIELSDADRDLVRARIDAAIETTLSILSSAPLDHRARELKERGLDGLRRAQASL